MSQCSEEPAREGLVLWGKLHRGHQPGLDEGQPPKGPALSRKAAQIGIL